MKYAIRAILAAATVAAAYYFTPSAPGKDIQAVELEQQYEYPRQSPDVTHQSRRIAAFLME